jgi:hypothetical protein
MHSEFERVATYLLRQKKVSLRMDSAATRMMRHASPGARLLVTRHALLFYKPWTYDNDILIYDTIR